MGSAMIPIDNSGVLRAALELIVAGGVTTASLWLLNPVAHRFDLLDRPQGRKDHVAPTPYTGGLAMLIGIVVTFGFISRWGPLFCYFVAAATMLVIIGALDDIYDLRWWWRVTAQCAAVLLLSFSGVSIEHVGQIVGLHTTGMGSLAIPFTMFATVGVINAINMSDGVDGLAGGIVLASLCMLEAAAIYSGNFGLGERLLIFIGVVLGFLVMNMRHPWQPRAKVFMGNAGSALLGFTIAWVSFRLTQNPVHPVTPILAPWLVATPVIDCVVLMIRRVSQGHSPFSADRGHMHHLMLDAGFRPGEVTVLMVAVNLLFGLFAGVALLLKVPQLAMVILFTCICIAYFCLSWRRERAVAAFAGLRSMLLRVGFGPKSDRSQSVRLSKGPGKAD